MRKLAITALAIASIAAPALALELNMNTVLGVTMDEVRTSLSAMGYEVRKAEMDDGEIEVYFVADGRVGEVYVSTRTGKPTKIEMK